MGTQDVVTLYITVSQLVKNKDGETKRILRQRFEGFTIRSFPFIYYWSRANRRVGL